MKCAHQRSLPRSTLPLLAAVLVIPWQTALAQEPQPNGWVKVEEDQVGPRLSPALIWSGEQKRFVLISGLVSHEHKGDKPYDVLSLDLGRNQWQNELPAGAEKRGGLTGLVSDPGFKSPYFEMADKDGVVRPHPHHSPLDYQFAHAPWDGLVYALMCGRTLRYDPAARTWKDLAPKSGPVAASNSYKLSLNWGALCADPINRELVLFGGAGLATDGAGPGTWVYSTETNTWRDLQLKVQPPPRALSPLTFDPVSKKIVLFGGDGLDQLRADTWLYDPATRTWEERQPDLSPSPRFGHALTFLPKSRKLVLLGGNGYTSSTSYLALLYRALPLEMWTYDVGRNAWALVQRFEQDAPTPDPTRSLAAVANDQDELLVVTTRRGSKSPPATWRCAVDVSHEDESGTAKFGVKAGTVEFRTGPYDPAWYEQEVPAADPAATAAVLDKLPSNRWVALECPKWPRNRMGGGWSTVAFDSDRDQILHLGGGHSSYFGNDVAHYDIRTGRWSISYRPQFALSYNYDLSGPGAWAFNNAPWGGHNYRAYAYDPTCRRLVYMRGPAFALFYDAQRRSWPFEEKLETPFPISKYTTCLCSTPRGMVAWTHTSPSGSGAMGLYLLESGKEWKALPTSGEALPVSVTDGSTISYDSRREQLVFTTTPGKDAAGQVWTCGLKSGLVRKMNPAGTDGVNVKRFAREAVYLPKADLLLLGYPLGGNTRTPFYDLAKNAWLTAEVPGSEFYARKSDNGHGVSVDLGLVYDTKRDLVWGVMCNLAGTGALNVMRIDAKELKLTPLATP